MNIALIGYGKMGKAIEELAISKGHEIVLKINSQNQNEFTDENIRKADVCIEFSMPETAFENIRKCLTARVPTISGSTAWLSRLDEAKDLAISNETSFLYASNFSIGVNLFFQINEFTAKLMATYPEYSISIEEIHHTAKKDAPSGTAVTLANAVIEATPGLKKWVNHNIHSNDELPITSIRQDPAPGTHIVRYHSTIDTIEIRHTAHSRTGFASGALMAAEFICNKKGIFTMKDVLQ